MAQEYYKSIIKFLALFIAVGLLWYSGRVFHIDAGTMQGSLARYPLAYSGALFIILYVLVTFFVWLSKDIFKFVGAVLFGAYVSTLFIWIAETINAFVLFSLSRFLGRSFVENSLKSRYNDLDDKLGKINFFWLFLTRCVPLVPFRFLDLAAGLTKISFKKYLVAVIFGSPLRILWVQYILAGVGESIFNNPYVLVEYLLSNKPLFFLSFVYFILAILVSFRIKLK